jgi:hypothetical protein
VVGVDETPSTNEDTTVDTSAMEAWLDQVKPVWWHGIGWCDYEGCPLTAPSLTRIITRDDKPLEVCFRCYDIVKVGSFRYGWSCYQWRRAHP